MSDDKERWRFAFPRPPDFTVIQGGEPYLRRWWIIPRRKFSFNIYLHNFLMSDDVRALHDHPWSWNISVLLRGSYNEVMEGPDPRAVGRQKLAEEHRRLRRPFHPVLRRGASPHRVELIEGKPVWSLFITGPVVREWGFLCPNGWRHWSKFVQLIPNGNETGPGCG